MTNDMYRGEGRLISGDSYRDALDLSRPSHLARAVDEVTAGGVTLPKVLLAERDRVVAEERRRAELADALDDLSEALERVRAEKAAAATQALRDRTVTFPNDSPQASDDWLVIGEPAASARPERWADVEIDGKIYHFYPHSTLHWVPAAIAEAWPRDLPGRVCGTDLLRIYRNDYTRVKAGGRQGTGPGYSEVEVDEDGLIAAASHIVRACSYRPRLEAWLAHAQRAGDEPGQVLVKVIEDRLRALGAEAAA